MSDASHAFCIYNPFISLGRGIKTNTMGLLDKIKDNFTKAEFTVSPQKKLKTLSAEFENAFGVELVFYKGKQIAEGASQVRTTGRFYTEMILSQITSRIQRCWTRVTAINCGHADVLSGNVDTHIVMSLAGGTGCGSFII